MNSVYDKLGRIRKPRVHITYDIETEGGTVQTELPFVVGVMGDYQGDYAGDPKNLKPLNQRKFVQIDRDNFDQVMRSVAPGLKLRVDNTLEGDSSQMSVDLKFNKLEDFEPANVAQQVPALKAMLDTRAKLRELLGKADVSENLESLLEQILDQPGKLDALKRELDAKKEGTQ